jgi:hypothetical protein
MDHYTYRCPLFIEGCTRWTTSITPIPPIPPTIPTLMNLVVNDHHPRSHGIHPPRLNPRLLTPLAIAPRCEKFPPNPHNSHVTMVYEIPPPPYHSTSSSYMDIWFMKSTECLPCPPVGPSTSRTNDVFQPPPTPPVNLDAPLSSVTDSLHSLTFQSDEDILEVLCTPDYPWDYFYH